VLDLGAEIDWRNVKEENATGGGLFLLEVGGLDGDEVEE